MKDDYVELNKETYNRVARDLRNRHKKIGKNEPKAEDYYNKIFKYLKGKGDLKYLELGPGDGNILKYFASKITNTYAIENSEEMIKLCKKVSPCTKIIEKNILDVNFENSNFDIIFAGSFIHLFPQKDVNIVMNKIYNWLNNDGVFFIYTTLDEKDEEGFFSKTKSIYPNENARFRHKYTEDSLKQLFINNDFNILEYYQISEPENDRIWQFIVATK